jgi:hypothetical protein
MIKQNKTIYTKKPMYNLSGSFDYFINTYDYLVISRNVFKSPKTVNQKKSPKTIIFFGNIIKDNLYTKVLTFFFS